MAAQYDLRDILPHIDPGLLSYQEWICVGMALKDGGYECEMWEDWSRRDAPRYHPGECEKKWASFRGAPAPVTGGTVVQLAREQGCYKLMLMTGSKRQSTLRFYERAGYRSDVKTAFLQWL